jgi:hypothetical protein
LVTWFFRDWWCDDLRFWDDVGGRWGWGRWSFDRGCGLRGLKCFFRIRTPKEKGEKHRLGRPRGDFLRSVWPSDPGTSGFGLAAQFNY